MPLNRLDSGPRPSAEVLAAELRRVLRAGLRPSRLARGLGELPLLAECAGDGVDVYEQALKICGMVEGAVSKLGNGAYAEAVGALFGAAPGTKGLLLPARRRTAASLLDVQVSTLMRHWEADILLDIAIEIASVNIYQSD